MYKSNNAAGAFAWILGLVLSPKLDKETPISCQIIETSRAYVRNGQYTSFKRMSKKIFILGRGFKSNKISIVESL